MKKMIYCSMLLIFVLLCGCSNNKASTLPVGEYILEGSDESVPCVYIEDDNKFVFMYNPFMNYITDGTYSIDNNKLILTDDDQEGVFEFKISGNSLILIGNYASEDSPFNIRGSLLDSATYTKSNNS